MDNIRAKNSIRLAGYALSCLLMIFGTGSAVAKVFTIGMINNVAVHTSAMDGFRAGMAELGYVEGRDVNYIYHGIVEGTPEEIDAEIKKMLAQDVDMFFTAGNIVTTLVKAAADKKKIPVLFALGSHPVSDGLVQSLNHPGGFVTGTRVPETTPKALEWLLKILPETRNVFLPFNPDDKVSLIVLDTLKNKATQLGIELVLCELTSVEAAKAAIESLPEDIDAILRIASPTLDTRNSELSDAAIKRGLPMVASLPLDDAVLLTCASDSFESGRQNARLAHLIIQGTKPGDLPVETTDPSFSINLDTAEKIGVYVPDEILVQAKKIIHR